MHRARKRLILEMVALIAASCIVIWQLLIPPIAGLADNGDYERVMSFFNLGHATTDPSSKYFGYLNTAYVYDPPDDGTQLEKPKLFSSEVLLAGLATSLAKILDKETFPLVALGATHSILFILSILLLLKATGRFAGKIRTIAILDRKSTRLNSSHT